VKGDKQSVEFLNEQLESTEVIAVEIKQYRDIIRRAGIKPN